MNSTENNNSSEVVVQASTQKKRIAVINLGSLLQIHTKKIKSDEAAQRNQEQVITEKQQEEFNDWVKGHSIDEPFQQIQQNDIELVTHQPKVELQQQRNNPKEEVLKVIESASFGEQTFNCISPHLLSSADKENYESHLFFANPEESMPSQRTSHKFGNEVINVNRNSLYCAKRIQKVYNDLENTPSPTYDNEEDEYVETRLKINKFDTVKRMSQI